MIEQLARASAEELRAATSSDVEAGLADLHARRVRHQRRTRVGLVAAALLAVGLASIGGAVLTHRAGRDVLPSNPPPSHSHAATFCPTIIPVKCLSHNTYQFSLTRPVNWRIPSDFDDTSGVFLPWMVQVVRNVGPAGHAGVTVVEGVRASSPNGKSPSANVPDTPQAFVHWVATRPFLAAGRVRTTTLAGHPAWQVRVTLRPGVPPGPATCLESEPCYALVHQPDGTDDGIWGNMSSEYTAFHLPGKAGTTVVWTWMFQHHPNWEVFDQAVHGLSWPAP